MENNGSDLAELGIVMNELLQGRDLARQLQCGLLEDPFLSSNGVVQKLMMQNVVASFERSIRVLRSDLLYQQSQLSDVGIAGSFNSLFSGCGSPLSQDSDGDFKDLDQRDESCEKRKRKPRWTQKVQGCSSTGLDGPIDDGYNWRKYGQKDILGAKYPRGYYRCTLRQLQGCMATKQVQRCDEDPAFFLVTYMGKHTCTKPPPPSSSSTLNNPTNIKPEPIETRASSKPPHQTIWSFQTTLRDIKPINHSADNVRISKSSSSFSFTASPSNFTDHNARVFAVNGAYNSAVSSQLFSPELFQFDQSGYPHDFMVNDPHFFP